MLGANESLMLLACIFMLISMLRANQCTDWYWPLNHSPSATTHNETTDDIEDLFTAPDHIDSQRVLGDTIYTWYIGRWLRRGKYIVPLVVVMNPLSFFGVWHPSENAYVCIHTPIRAYNTSAPTIGLLYSNISILIGKYRWPLIGRLLATAIA